MNSPITGGHATLVEEKATTVYRGEKFDYTRRYYRCDDTGITFTDDETDAWGLEQIYSQYREKYGIPAPEEIKAIRKQYGLSATTMSKILGIGDNQYSLYEHGEMPTKNIGRMISSIDDKNIFCFYLKLAKNQFAEKEYDRILKKVENVLSGVVYYYVDVTYRLLNRYVIQTHPAVYESKNIKSRWCTVHPTSKMAIA